MTSTTMLIDLFYDEATVMSNLEPYGSEDIRTIFYENVKLGLTHPDRVFKITVWGASFALLDHLIQVKSAESPVLMKTLIGAFTELLRRKDHKDRMSEKFILENYYDLFDKHRELVTLNLVLDPVIHSFSERLRGDR